MLITTTRTVKTVDGIFGNLQIDVNPFKCIVLERRGMEIPVGVFDIQFMLSEHFQQIMPQIIVPGRTAIEQHWANYPVQLDGCQALGTQVELSADCIDESKNAWKAYIQVILNQSTLKLKVIEDYGV